MKPLLSMLVALAFDVLLFGCASLPQPAMNNVGKTDAIKIAGLLFYGMREMDALRYLHQNGFTIDNVPRAGDSFGWTHSFLLADGSFLSLEITPEPLRSDVAWANGRVRAACIQTSSAKVEVVIVLTRRANWDGLCAAIDGFRVRYGRWPIRVRIFPASLADIRDHLLTPEDYAQIVAKVALLADESAMIAEDDQGGSYSYAQEGFPSERPTPGAAEWLGVRPKIEEH
jgi:hypothetical protein